MKIKLLSDLATVPTKGSADSAGYDLYAATSVNTPLYAGETTLISTDIAVEIPKGYFGAIYPRSGLATKQGIRCANCVGVIDADYRGPIKVALHNDSGNAYWIAPKERIAQLIVTPYNPVELEVVDELSDTERGAGGFGSTGKTK